MLGRVRRALTPVNESKWVAGVGVLLLNVLGRSPKIHLTASQRSVVDGIFGEQVFIFTAAFVTTRDVVTSLLLTAVFYAVVQLFRYAYPGKTSGQAQGGQTNNGVSNEAIGHALDVLEKAYQDRRRRAMYKGGQPWQLF